MDHRLRKDQINFVEKEFNGSSNLYSLFDFSTEEFKRADISYMKRYLSGQFGAAPIISSEDLRGTVDRIATEGKTWHEDNLKKKTKEGYSDIFREAN